jgi:ribosomal protein S18 acetylase RimI-like enzyme
MEIRLLTADDACEWSRLRRESLEGDPEAFSSSAEEHQALSLEEVRMRLGSEATDSFVVGAFDDGSLIGTAGFYREKGLKVRHKGRVWGVYVTPQRRGEGIGRKLVQTALERGAEIEGVDQIIVSVATTQTAAASLYRSLGFQPFGCEPRALKIGERFIDEEFMVLRTNRGQSPR